ncbi:hypothetical protein [Geomesophilobacter sediminis]|uniref:Uncharacterized protein n=1 Tax=Geomesophilobacter sediminis TaxID=2798584 RepID=A0A8J7JBL7_9BACT|nr:hypothetical protein [Geomesophilobacter sediminis]MBJ6724566.1 hypothetical protein [Geomesophilobacter sediminis]
MRCGYKDDFKIDYSGSLHITKGEGCDIVVKESHIPTNIKSCLDSAVERESCHELRSASRALTRGIEEAFDVE